MYTDVCLSGCVSGLRAEWGRRLTAARKAAGLSQVRLAAEMATTQQNISKWERGVAAPRDDTRMRLAAILGVAVQDIFTYPTNGEGEAA